MKPETKFRRYEVDPFLKSLPGTYFDAIQQKGKAGSPDYYLCVRGFFVALEIKDVKGKVSKIQERKLLEVEERGEGISLVASPLNWEEVKRQLRALAQGEWDG